MPERDDMPSTVRRSSKEAQDTWAKVRDSAVEQYGEGRRAYQTAYAALKHKFEKVGDHWRRKAHGRKGPSDEEAAKPRARRDTRKTAEGVDAKASKQHLYEVAKALGIKGRSSMSKSELVDAIKKANRRETARARR
ncbi:cation transport regulator ChaB [Actinomadura craniellae]|uniref:Cation transport regulator ChaB n=1 Tax=Actinomadura craniellae TaxID=2231787 RepID=A0A365HA68_9ACTN|nr:ChaB family protein [Actinomadura craniellae]RAY15898.1 cation transport regulator ChaB [Actinomadura craniellae]